MSRLVDDRRRMVNSMLTDWRDALDSFQTKGRDVERRRMEELANLADAAFDAYEVIAGTEGASSEDWMANFTGELRDKQEAHIDRRTRNRVSAEAFFVALCVSAAEAGFEQSKAQNPDSEITFEEYAKSWDMARLDDLIPEGVMGMMLKAVETAGSEEVVQKHILLNVDKPLSDSLNSRTLIRVEESGS